jgi:hypothetical protein
MRDIELINTSQILKELDTEIRSFVSENGSSDSSKYWSNVLEQLSSNYTEYISWSNIGAFESGDIEHLEALFLLLDLPTRFLLKNKNFEKKLLSSNDLLDTKVQELFLETAENMTLSNSVEVRATDGWGNETNKINVAGFINWSLHSAGFIKLSDNNLKSSVNKKIKNKSRSKEVEETQKIVDEYIHEYFKKHKFTSERQMSIYIESRTKEDSRLYKKTLGFERIRKEYLTNSTVFLEYTKSMDKY